MLRDEGVLVAVSPLVFTGVVLLGGAAGENSPWRLPAAGAAALAVAAGAFFVTRAPRWGAGLVTAGILASLALALPGLVERPAVTLSILLLVSTVLISLWSPPSRSLRLGEGAVGVERARAAGSAFTTLTLWLLLSLSDGRSLPWLRIALYTSMLIAAWRALTWIRTMPQAKTARLALLGLVLGCAGAAVLAWRSEIDEAERAAVGAIAAVFLLTLAGLLDRASALWGIVAYHPARLVVTSFLLLSVVGALVLALPFSSAGGEPIGLVDAFFTSVSAVCVTGLIVLDTPVDFSRFGQGVILVLIQVGGLGIMSLSALTLGLLGRRLSMRHESAVATAVGGSGGDLMRGLRLVVATTAILELAGTALLYPAFRAAGDGALGALWRALFTSVSAFCNAGFSLQTESLIPYQTQPIVLHTVALLIVAGGLSPGVLAALPALARRRPTPLGAKIALSASAALLVAGFVAFAALEWSASLQGLSVAEHLHNAWFQSVTTRTAGFNSVAMADLQPATVTLFMGLMFIGGSPGGTAGGIKTTTFIVLFLAVAGAVSGRSHASSFGRRLPHATVYRAAAIATLGTLSFLVSLLLIQLTQRLDGLAAVFEVVSALGTVGLTLGATPLLDDVGKVIIMVSMFLGRVGPLTAFLFLYERQARRGWSLPEEDVQVG